MVCSLRFNGYTDLAVYRNPQTARQAEVQEIKIAAIAINTLSGRCVLRVVNGMHYDSFNVFQRHGVIVFKVYTPFSRFYLRVFNFEFFDMVIAASVERNIIFLVGDRDPSVSVMVGRHFVSHIDDCLGERFRN